jgi:hypothetical protein
MAAEFTFRLGSDLTSTLIVSSVKQDPEPNEYVKILIPVPAIIGLKLIPVTPGPDQVPVNGENPLSVIDGEFKQTANPFPASAVCGDTTITVMLSVLEQPVIGSA